MHFGSAINGSWKIYDLGYIYEVIWIILEIQGHANRINGGLWKFRVVVLVKHKLLETVR